MDVPTDTGSALAAWFSLLTGITGAVCLYRWVIREKTPPPATAATVAWASVIVGSIISAVTMRVVNGPRVLLYSYPERQQFVVTMTPLRVLALAFVFATVFSVGLYLALKEHEEQS